MSPICLLISGKRTPLEDNAYALDADIGDADIGDAGLNARIWYSADKIAAEADQTGLTAALHPLTF